MLLVESKYIEFSIDVKGVDENLWIIQDMIYYIKWTKKGITKSSFPIPYIKKKNTKLKLLHDIMLIDYMIYIVQ